MNFIDQALCESLRKLHDEMQDAARWREVGICTAVKIHLSDARLDLEDYLLAGDRLHHLMQEWPKATGDPSYVVPAPDAGTPALLEEDKGAARSVEKRGQPPEVVWYNLASGAQFWDRESSGYAKSRWELLEWLIDELRRTD